ncbi:UPF0178 protein yaiI [Desulfovibrio sp. X2]|uniref:YaiI/YqxD family protein n=1 Tax=Desulfovibrio sp. X2 TaxID=941449 RepID=UPI000358CF10|nr:YaiI/YqxD family protein [Desulfovibrio sp. X2]EPR37213.1 UPF0178 protein yaiI [Desulfovibrio sp. X2]
MSGRFPAAWPPTIWVDDDACPSAIREIVLRASKRLGLPVRLVANRPRMVDGADPALVVAVRVPGGFDEADRHIAEHVAPGDLVVTADVPLAAQVVERGATGLNPRGEVYDAGNVRGKLTMRNFMQEMRDMGLAQGGPAPLGPRDRQLFAASLDRILTTQQRAAQDAGPGA